MLITLALTALLSSSALADDTIHPQVNAIVQGTHVVNEAWEVRGSGHFFWAPGPEEDTALSFLYAGPKFHVAPWLSIAPQTGAVVNWNGTGDLLPLVSLWNWIEVSHFHFFVEADVYPDFAGGAVSYYGLYAADYDRLKLVWVGAQVEQVNANVNVGPHIGLPLGDYVCGYRRTTTTGSATGPTTSASTSTSACDPTAPRSGPRDPVAPTRSRSFATGSSVFDGSLFFGTLLRHKDGSIV